MGELRAGPGLRVVRGLVAAAFAAGLGVAAHVGAGGLLPPVPWLAVILLGVTAVTIGAIGVPAGLVRIAALVAGGQFFTHLMLTALAGHAGSEHAAAVAPAVQPSFDLGSNRQGSFYDLTMGPSAAVNGQGPELPHWLSHIVEDLSGPHAVMACGHLAAALIIAWWLAQGERALWSLIVLVGSALAGVLHSLLPHPVVVPTAAPLRPGAGGREPRVRPLLLALSGALVRRGPPLVAN